MQFKKKTFRVALREDNSSETDYWVSQMTWVLGNKKFSTEKRSGNWYIVEEGTVNRFPLNAYNLKLLSLGRPPQQV